MRLSLFLTIIAFSFFTQPLHADIKNKKKSEKKKKIELTDTYWRLAEFNGKPLPATEGNTTPYIYMKHKGKALIGHTGCNEIAGKFDAGKDNEVGFEATYTDMSCPQAQVEQYLQSTLKHADRYEINGNNLLLYTGNMLIGVFEAQ